MVNRGFMRFSVEGLLEKDFAIIPVNMVTEKYQERGLYCIQTRDENSVSRKWGFNKKPVSTFRGCHLISNKRWCPKSEIFQRTCAHFYGYILNSHAE